LKSFRQIFKEAENKVSGVAAAPGIVISKAYLYTKETILVNHENIADVSEAKKNFKEAIQRSKKELNKIFSLAKEKMGETRSAIFEAQLMILDDPILIENIEKRIEKEKRSPEYVVDDEISKYINMMKSAHEIYMNERAHDIEDIKNRIIRNLQKKRWVSRILNDVTIVSDMLTPADTILFSRCNVQGFVTDHGGLTSHAAIVSRSLNIPAVVGTHDSTKKIRDGDIIIVDGFHGYVIVNPTEEQLHFFAEKQERLLQLQKDLEEFKDKKSVTKDKREIKLLANVDVTGEIDIVITSGAQGIGLYRSEQILDELGEFPEEEVQAKIYERLASRIYPEIITIRAFDIGGDKFKLGDFSEPNPFLGLRGIRLLLDNKNLFRNQIRAVLKASQNRNIHFMLPMVSTISEIIETRRLIEECKKELKNENVKFDKNMPVGIMVEVPSAAVMTDMLAREADFFSIGTNDLIQYLMAVDRGNDLVSHLYQEFHPTVLKTIGNIVTAAHKAGKPVSICGEMAADTLAIPILVGLGLKELSMSPATIPYAKRIILSFAYKDAQHLANECLQLDSQEEVIKRIEKFFKDQAITRTRQII
jgi:phosphoenolpyruvate-protein phosphotransferase (PTS system enzyme I)